MRRIPKPSHLSEEYAAQFKDVAVAMAYRFRPPYPDELFPMLVQLIRNGPQRVLDLGTGTGALARGLAPLVDRVDAVDFSSPLLEIAKRSPNGTLPNIQWICGSAEDAALDPPYGLVTAGCSLHWMNWDVVLPRIEHVLAGGCYLALIDEHVDPVRWDDDLKRIIPKHSTNRDYRPFVLTDELSARRLFATAGRFRTGTAKFTQTIQDYVESMHGRNGFSRDRMTATAAAAFDREMRAVVEPHCPDGVVTLEVSAEVVFGLPLSPQ